MGKKSHRTQVRVRSRQVLRTEDHSVRWPVQEEQATAEHPPIGGDDEDDNNEQPGLPLALANKIGGEDDQPEFHIYDIQEPADQDGCIDPDGSWDGEYDNVGDWEED